MGHAMPALPRVAQRRRRNNASTPKASIAHEPSSGTLLQPVVRAAFSTRSDSAESPDMPFASFTSMANGHRPSEPSDATVPVMTGGAAVDGRLDADRWTAMAAFMTDHGLIEGDVDATGAFTNDFVAP